MEKTRVQKLLKPLEVRSKSSLTIGNHPFHLDRGNTSGRTRSGYVLSIRTKNKKDREQEGSGSSKTEGGLKSLTLISFKLLDGHPKAAI